MFLPWSTWGCSQPLHLQAVSHRSIIRMASSNEPSVSQPFWKTLVLNSDGKGVKDVKRCPRTPISSQIPWSSTQLPCTTVAPLERTSCRQGHETILHLSVFWCPACNVRLSRPRDNTFPNATTCRACQRCLRLHLGLSWVSNYRVLINYPPIQLSMLWGLTIHCRSLYICLGGKR